MSNDLIRLAMERAVRVYDHRGGKKIFNAAGFAGEFAKLAGVSTRVDGLIVRAMLTGRSDVVPLAGGAHYHLRASKE